MLKSSVRMESLNKEKIKEITQEKGFSKETIALIISLIENCEKAKFSKSSDTVMNNDLESAKEVINTILKS